MGKTTLILAFFWFALSATATASTLYRCVDESNHATYTNYKGANRKCTVLSRENAPRSNSSEAPKPANSTKQPSPPDFPKVANATQKSRDGDRRYILEQELSAEQKNLDEARKSLADQLNAQPAGVGPERTQSVRDRIALHQRNLDALRREIANLK